MCTAKRVSSGIGVALTGVMLVMLLAPPVFATESRVVGMGGVGMYMYDDTNLFVLPSIISKYRNEVVSELGVNGTVNTNRTAGVNYYLENSGFDLGIYFNRMTGTVLQNNYTNIALDRSHLFLFGMEPFAFGLGFGSDSWSDDNAAVGALKNESTRLIELLFGMGLEAAMPIEFGAKIGLGSGTIERVGDPAAASGTPNEQAESYLGINLAGRSWMEFGSDTWLVPVVVFGLSSGTIETPNFTDGAERKFSGFGLGIGAAINTRLDEDNLLIIAVEPFGLSSDKETNTNTAGETVTTVGRTVLPAFFVALESEVTEWLTARLGVGQVFDSEKQKSESTPTGGTTTTTETKGKNATFGMTFGIGVHFGNFVIDGVFNDQFLYNGPELVTGNNTNPLLWRVSLRYAFGE